MIRLIFIAIASIALASACIDGLSLAESSFGHVGKKTSRASPDSVISMGRDDDDGQAKKWHIGGKLE